MSVHNNYQNRGIGKKLIEMVRKKAAGRLRVILVSTKEAHSFYEKMDFQHHPRAWIIPGDIL
jgi:predicted N-acetyltransferase YhbS